MLIPQLVVFIGAYAKKPIIPMLLLSSSIAVIFAVTIQGFDILTALDAFIKGFNVEMLGKIGVDSQSIMPEIVTLLNRGGMMGMMSTVLLILCAFSFAGIVSRVGCMEVILSMIVSKITSVGNLILSTVIATILMSIVTGSSYLAILIPGEMFKDLYKRWGLHSKNLSRTLEDAGTCVVPLVPWSIAGIYMSTTLGVPTLEYLPFAVLCYSSFIFAIIFGYTGFGITRIKKEKKI